VLTKDEGTPLALAALALAAMTILWRRWQNRAGALAPLLPAVLLVLAALALLASWRAGIPLRYSDAYRSSVTLLPAREIGARFAGLPAKIGKEMFAFKHWGFFWSAAPMVLLAGWRGLRRRSAPALCSSLSSPPSPW